MNNHKLLEDIAYRMACYLEDGIVFSESGADDTIKLNLLAEFYEIYNKDYVPELDREGLKGGMDGSDINSSNAI